MEKELREDLQNKLDALLTPGEMATAFGVARQTVWYWTKEDELPCIKLGGDAKNTVRFIPSEVKEWAKTRDRKVVATIRGKLRKDYY